MVVKNVVLDKEELLKLIEEAKGFVDSYDAENRRTPQHRYDYGSIDAVALRLLEQQEQVVATGISLNIRDVHLHVQRGYLGNEGILWMSEPGRTYTYLLPDFKGTTVARFVYSLGEIVIDRARNGLPELKAIMLPNTVAFARRTQEVVQPYLSKR
jgi:hypothetical protein